MTSGHLREQERADSAPVVRIVHARDSLQARLEERMALVKRHERAVHPALALCGGWTVMGQYERIIIKINRPRYRLLFYPLRERYSHIYEYSSQLHVRRN